MNLKHEQDIRDLISKDQWMMDILKATKTLNLPDWWICAGFIRSKIWDTLHQLEERTALSDIDVIYFDDTNQSEAEEKHLEKKLYKIIPDIPWSVKNEARMHVRNGVDPYLSTVDAIGKFPETATALGIRLDHHNQLQLTAPHGVEDVLNMIVRPTPLFKNSKTLMDIFHKRMETKKWERHWHQITISD